MLRRHGWKQTEIARAAGVAESTISNAKVRGTTIDETTEQAILECAAAHVEAVKDRGPPVPDAGALDRRIGLAETVALDDLAHALHHPLQFDLALRTREAQPTVGWGSRRPALRAHRLVGLARADVRRECGGGFRISERNTREWLRGRRQGQPVCGDCRDLMAVGRPARLTFSGQKREPLIVRLTWRGHLVLIAGVALLLAVLLAGTAVGHNQRTAIRQGGVVVAWVSGGGSSGERYWLYCDNEETVAYDGGWTVGCTWTSRTDTLGVGRPGRHQRLEGMGQSGAHGDAPSSSEASFARVHHAGTSSVLRDSPSTPNGCGSNLVSLLRPWGAMASRLAHRSSSNPALAGEELTGSRVAAPRLERRSAAARVDAARVIPCSQTAVYVAGETGVAEYANVDDPDRRA